MLLKITIMHKRGNLNDKDIFFTKWFPIIYTIKPNIYQLDFQYIRSNNSIHAYIIYFYVYVVILLFIYFHI